MPSPRRSLLYITPCIAAAALRTLVQAAQLFHSGGDASDRAAGVTRHIRENTGVAEHIPRRLGHGRVGPELAADGACGHILWQRYARWIRQGWGGWWWGR
jgi:hypothetical protein